MNAYLIDCFSFIVALNRYTCSRDTTGLADYMQLEFLIDFMMGKYMDYVKPLIPAQGTHHPVKVLWLIQPTSQLATVFGLTT